MTRKPANQPRPKRRNKFELQLAEGQSWNPALAGFFGPIDEEGAEGAEEGEAPAEEKKEKK